MSNERVQSTKLGLNAVIYISLNSHGLKSDPLSAIKKSLLHILVTPWQTSCGSSKPDYTGALKTDSSPVLAELDPSDTERLTSGNNTHGKHNMAK